jgi:CheY-like chemotaxis protein
MIRRVRPGVLVVDGDAGNRRRIAALLGESGIGVSAVADGDAALAAMARCRFDLAIVGTGIDLTAGFAAGTLAFEVAPFDPGEPRRFVGRVRDRLLGQELPADTEDDAGIAAAKLACLDRRQNAARQAGAAELVASLAREIAETAALGQTLH